MSDGKTHFVGDDCPGGHMHPDVEAEIARLRAALREMLAAHGSGMPHMIGECGPCARATAALEGGGR